MPPPPSQPAASSSSSSLPPLQQFQNHKRLPCAYPTTCPLVCAVSCPVFPRAAMTSGPASSTPPQSRYTPNPKPQTQTPNPKPHTQNPKPKTPKPKTQNPKPKTPTTRPGNLDAAPAQEQAFVLVRDAPLFTAMQRNAWDAGMQASATMSTTWVACRVTSRLGWAGRSGEVENKAHTCC